MSIRDNMLDLIKEISGMKTVNIEDNLQTDLGLDSMQLVILLIQMEERLHIEFNETDMNPFDLVTAGDVVLLAERYCGDDYEKEN